MWLGWWVPIVNVWFPFQVLRDVRDGSIADQPAARPRRLWWAAFLVVVALDQVVDADDLVDEPA